MVEQEYQGGLKMLDNQETVYKTLIKINQIGKKLAGHSRYILSNGLMLSHTKQEMGDVEANPISIAIISDKLLNKLEGISDNIAIKIDGNLLYKYSQDYDFDSIEIREDLVLINFIYYSVSEDGYEKGFEDLLKKNGFSESDIELAKSSNYTTNMDMYDLLLEYKKSYTPIEEKTYISIECPFVKKSFIINKANNIISEMDDSEVVYIEDLEGDLLEFVTSARQPVTRTCKLVNGEILRLRLMKSLFNPIASKHTAKIKVYQNSKRFILCSVVNIPDIIVFNIFQVIKY